MKRKRAYAKRILALCMAVFLCIGTGSLVAAARKADADTTKMLSDDAGAQEKKVQNVRATLGGNRVVDANTMVTRENIAKQSTQYTGRIWTDKSVFTDGVTLPGSSEEVGGGDIAVEQGDSDFLVGLSALSSTSNMTTQSATPLDIVLVLDTSGSMAYGMDGDRNPQTVPAEYKYEEVYLTNEDDGNTYYIKNGNNWQEVKWYNRFLDASGWRYGGILGALVVPKSNTTDTSSDHVQFYKRSEVTPEYRDTRLHSMQTAVNGFIDSTAKANKDMAENNKHRISIVTYADSANMGANLQEVTAETAASLKNTVNSLSAYGATNAGAGMTNANEELQSERARANAQEIVIFFTDGTPTTHTEFNVGVANTAVAQAGEIKSEERGGLVYSIGIFEGANSENPTNNSSRENQFMNAVSSNYPNATAYNSRGDRVDDKYQYYKTATESGELNRVFEDIFEEIKNPGSVPTEVTGGDPMNSGYITFEDELGAYMKVDGFNEIVFADQKFTEVKKTTSGNTDTYTFSGTVAASDLYPNGNLGEIKIQVEKSNKLAQGDMVTVKIPAALIPLRQFDVRETEDGAYETTVSNTYPMRIFFGVSLKEDAAAMLENPDRDMKQHIADNTGDDGKVNFYSNAFTKDAAMGNTTASFTPADTNSFYYFGQDSVLYIDENCETPATRQNSGNDTIKKQNYWYQRTYYAVGKTTPQTENIHITGDLAAELLGYAEQNDADQWYIPKEAPRLATIHNTHLVKKSNVTGTAGDVINPQWGRNENNEVIDEVNVYLGNNGKLSLDVPGALEISKAVTAEEGLIAPDKEFTFEVDLEAAQGTALKDSYTAQKFDKDGKASGEAFTVADNGTVKLKAGEKVQIYGLANGTQYSVKEENLPKGFTQTTPADNAPATGTIGTDADTNGMNQAAFVNTYSTAPAVVDLSETAGFTKAITGRDWKEGDSFAFNITGTAQDGNTAPMPQKDGKDVTSVTVDYDMAQGQDKTAAGEETGFGFGTITFNKAGEYTYQVTEDKAGTTENGLTYSGNTATVTITVEDKDGTGKLTATPVISRPKFENTYKAALDYTDKGNIAIFKTLHGTNVKDNQFSFKVKAKDKATEDRLKIPMDGIIEETNPATEGQRTEVARLSQITFTEADAGKTYTFTVEEVKAGGNGFVYDNTVYEVAIAVTDLGEGKLQAVTTVRNTTDNEKVSETTWRTDSAAGTTPIALDFTNVYHASGDVAIKVTKEVTGGRPLKEGEFTFKLTTEPNNGGTGTEVAAATNKADGTVDFGTFTYATTGYRAPEGAVNLTDIIGDDGYASKNVVEGKDVYTVNYIASEVTNDLPVGMTASTEPFAVTVTVTDNGDGTLTAKADTGKFTNAYATVNDDILIKMNGTKTIDTNGVEGLTRPELKGNFTFNIKALDGAPEPTNTTAKTDENGNVDFGTATFNSDFLEDVTAAEDGSRTKEFTYEVTEVKGDLPGVTYDAEKKTFTVTLKDDGNGNLSATTSNADGQPLFAFKNSYGVEPKTSSITDTIQIQKVLEGRTLNKGEFTFQLTENVDGKDTVVATGTNDADGKVTFESIEYTKPGNHTYTVREQIPEGAADGVYEGVTYDKAIYTITTEVTDNGDGTLQVTHAVKDDEKITFTNKYEAKQTAVILNASKKLVDKKLEDGQFTFELKDENDKLVGKAKKNNADGQVVFDEITYDKAGTYKYTVSEVNDKQDGIIYDDKKYSVEVKVTDNGKGSYVAEVSYPDGAPAFVNAYKKPAEPAKPEKPDGNNGDGNVVSAKTGDTAQTGLWIVLMLAALVGIGAILVIRRQHRKYRR